MGKRNGPEGVHIRAQTDATPDKHHKKPPKKAGPTSPYAVDRATIPVRLPPADPLSLALTHLGSIALMRLVLADFLFEVW